jgi:hypothetical protein
MTEGWRFTYDADEPLPPLSWLAVVDTSAKTIRVACGSSVVTSDDGFFEGTWVGPNRLAAIPSSTTVFGSGIVLHEGAPLAVTPSHTIGGVFVHRTPDGTMLSNSLVAIVSAAGLELDRKFDYPGAFVRTIDGIAFSPISVPTSGGSVHFHFFWNLRVGDDGMVTQVDKPREADFTSYADYRARVAAALESALANVPAYEPVVALSSGYDSTAVAALAAEHGCRRAVTLAKGRTTRKSGPDAGDSGAATAERLGISADVFDRLAYLDRADMPEAEFLATGMSGEDIVMSSFEPCLYRSVLLTGTQGNGIWRVHGNRRSDLSRSALDGASLGEFRLRTDFVFMPLAIFGLTQRPSLMDVSASDEMKPWSVGGRYDQPISRRIAEEAGLPRRSFAVRKRAASAPIHSDGEGALSATTAAAVRRFAQAEGSELTFDGGFRLRTWHRLALRVAPLIRAGRFTAGLTHRRRRLVHFDAASGNLLLRWSVSVIRPRYAALAKRDVEQRRSG